MLEQRVRQMIINGNDKGTRTELQTRRPTHLRFNRIFIVYFWMRARSKSLGLYAIENAKRKELCKFDVVTLCF